MSEVAYKFTRAGARSPFTGFQWTPGEWTEVEGAVGLCSNGVHACRVDALPRWLDEELWRVELDDVHEEIEGVLVARSGRLVNRIGRWDDERSRELGRSCAVRAREIADQHPQPLVRKMAEDVAAIAEGPDPSATALAAYCTAHAADVAVPGGYDEERRRQAEWLAAHLGLTR